MENIVKPEKVKKATSSLDMTQGNPAKLLILFAIPMLIGGVFQLLYTMVDSIVVGKFVGEEALAAIGATSSSTALLTMLGSGMTNACSVLISQEEGAKNYSTLKKAVTHSLYLSMAAGLLLGLGALLGGRPLLQLLNTPKNILNEAVNYLTITGGLTGALLFYNGAAAVLRAIGDSRTPLYFLIFSSLLNVVLDLLFVLGLQAGVSGVAWATVISQGVSAALCLCYMFRRYPRLRPNRQAWRFDGKMMGDYLRIGLPLCLQSSLLSVGMFVITAVINSFGSDIVAAYTIGTRVEQLATVTFSNVAFSFSVYAGQNFGAQAYDRIEDGLKKGLLIIGGLSLLSTCVMQVFAEPLANLFMKEQIPQVLEGSVSMIRIESSFFLALGAIWTVNSALRGIGAVKITLISSIVELASKIGFSLVLPHFLGYTGIWLAAPIGWVLGLIPSLLYLLRWLSKHLHTASDASL